MSRSLQVSWISFVRSVTIYAIFVFNAFYSAIMNYDVWGSWSTSAGPNAPLNDTCAPSADQEGSAVSAVDAWTSAGFPHSQIVLGVASYGHSFSVSKTDAINSSGSDSDSLNLYPAFDAADQPAGDAWDSTAGDTDVCGNPTTVGGVFNFWGLISDGFLSANGTAAEGIDYTYDNCSQTVSKLRFAHGLASHVYATHCSPTSTIQPRRSWSHTMMRPPLVRLPLL